MFWSFDRVTLVTSPGLFVLTMVPFLWNWPLKCLLLRNYNVNYFERTGKRYNDLWNFDFDTVRGDRKSLIFAGPLLRNYAKIF